MVQLGVYIVKPFSHSFIKAAHKLIIFTQIGYTGIHHLNVADV